MGFQITRKATARWSGSDSAGGGTISLGSGSFEGPFSLKARVEDTPQSNPEELIGAALAACFTMSVSNKLTEAGYEVKLINTESRVRMAEEDGSYSITGIRLEMSADVPGISVEELRTLAAEAKAGCPVSRALAGTTITLEVKDPVASVNV